jgi:hypothetical protein
VSHEQDASLDQALDQEMIELSNKLLTTLRTILPELSGEELGALSWNLAGYWRLAVKHQKRVDALLQLRGPSARAALAECLSDLIYDDVELGLTARIEQMREILPKIIDRLDSE